jgi:hypothetical protein
MIALNGIEGASATSRWYIIIPGGVDISGQISRGWSITYLNKYSDRGQDPTTGRLNRLSESTQRTGNRRNTIRRELFPLWVRLDDPQQPSNRPWIALGFLRCFQRRRNLQPTLLRANMGSLSAAHISSKLIIFLTVSETIELFRTIIRSTSGRSCVSSIYCSN